MSCSLYNFLSWGPNSSYGFWQNLSYYVTWCVTQLRTITKGNSGPHMIKRLRYQPFCYQFFNQCLDCVALLFTGNLNQCLDYVDLLFSTNLYTKTLQTWNTWMLTASLMWIAILSPNLNWRWRITESATILYVAECRLSIMSYYNLLWSFLPLPQSTWSSGGTYCYRRFSRIRGLRETVIPPCIWQHCPATHPKICDKQLPLHNARNCWEMWRN